MSQIDCRFAHLSRGAADYVKSYTVPFFCWPLQSVHLAGKATSDVCIHILLSYALPPFPRSSASRLILPVVGLPAWLRRLRPRGSPALLPASGARAGRRGGRRERGRGWEVQTRFGCTVGQKKERGGWGGGEPTGFQLSRRCAPKQEAEDGAIKCTGRKEREEGGE